VRAAVEGWGGRFLVERRPGVWNRYTLMLPECVEGRRPMPEASGAAEVDEVGREAGLRVLVVDDNPALRSVLKRYLERRGHQVTEAGDGEQALDLCGEEVFDRLLVDVCMPTKTGPEFYTGLASVAPALQAKTYFMTGGGLEAGDQRLVLESGRPAIMKPFALSEVAETVEAGA
jgi:CheY-like chemotaxis protein